MRGEGGGFSQPTLSREQHRAAAGGCINAAKGPGVVWWSGKGKSTGKGKGQGKGTGQGTGKGKGKGKGTGKGKGPRAPHPPHPPGRGLAVPDSPVTLDFGCDATDFDVEM